MYTKETHDLKTTSFVVSCPDIEGQPLDVSCCNSNCEFFGGVINENKQVKDKDGVHIVPFRQGVKCNRPTVRWYAEIKSLVAKCTQP